MAVKRTAMLLAVCICAAHAEADPISRDVVKGLENCFSLARSASSICDKLSNDTAVRLDCLQEARDAQQDCLDHLRSSMEQEERAPVRLPAAPEPSAPAPAPQPPTTARESDADKDTDRALENNPDHEPTAAESRPAFDNTPKRAPENPKPPVIRATAWIVSEMASPIDFSPMIEAELPALSITSPKAPSVLVLRCHNGRTEFAVRTQGIWHPWRTGDVEFTMIADGNTEMHSRWLVAPDGKSASSREDAAGAVQALLARRMSVSISDETGNGGTSEFDLSGIDAVRTKLAATCHWPHSEAGR